MLKPIIIATLMVPLSTAPVDSPANAQTVSKRVSYADLDLTTESGRETLSRRIAKTARELCGGSTPGQEIGLRHSIRRCQVKAIADTRVQVASAVSRASSRQLASR
jgi:UrcA family protein